MGGHKHSRAGSPQAFFERPLAAAAGLTRHDQIKAWHEGERPPAALRFRRREIGFRALLWLAVFGRYERRKDQERRSRGKE